MTGVDDQRLAGSVMMIEGSLVTIIALAWLFLQARRGRGDAQRLLERGLDPRPCGGPCVTGAAQELEQAR